MGTENLVGRLPSAGVTEGPLVKRKGPQSFCTAKKNLMPTRIWTNLGWEELQLKKAGTLHQKAWGGILAVQEAGRWGGD